MIKPSWSEDKEFVDFFNKNNLKELSMISPNRLYILYRLCIRNNKLFNDSNIAEVGVRNGGSAKLLLELCKNSTIYLFDTFTGLPKTTNEKYDPKQLKEHSFNTNNPEQTINMLSKYKNSKIYKGFFPDTAKDLNDFKFSIVHIDVDIYQSAKDCCEFFYEKLESGGIMIFDDFGFEKTAGVKLAVDEFFKDKDNIAIDLGNIYGMVIKK